MEKEEERMKERKKDRKKKRMEEWKKKRKKKERMKRQFCFFIMPDKLVCQAATFLDLNNSSLFYYPTFYKMSKFVQCFSFDFFVAKKLKNLK